MKLTEAHYDFLSRVRDGLRLKLAGRDEDKVRQFCRRHGLAVVLKTPRRHGLAVVLKNPRRWKITEAGRAALKQKDGGNG